jgi:long-chain acyl-CoA synthetase
VTYDLFACGDAALDHRAARVAAGLLAAGLHPGDRVLALLHNGAELIELLRGCMRSGTVFVPMNWRLSPDELTAVAADADARAIVASNEEQLEQLGRGSRNAQLFINNYDDWIAGQDRVDSHGQPPNDDVVLQIYTSGTSGRPKGVLLTYGNLAAKLPRAADSWRFGAHSVSLLATPMFHIGGLGWALVGLHSGARTIMAGPTPPAELADLLRRERVTHAFLVPTQLQGICDIADGGGFPDLQVVVYGAAPMSADTQSAVLDTFDCTLLHVYGMTETTGSITQHALTRSDIGKPQTAGEPYPGVELTIHDPTTRAMLPAGVPGEIWTRSAQNTPGYAGDPEATRRLLTADGWLRTGDIGYLDDAGRLFVTDRLKDLIITGGENVVPAEVEKVLREHHDVADVAVIGLPDVRWGEVVAAVIVPRPGRAPSLDDVVAFTADRLAGYKRPRALHLVGALPRGATGKVRKQALVEELSRGR